MKIWLSVLCLVLLTALLLAGCGRETGNAVSLGNANIVPQTFKIGSGINPREYYLSHNFTISNYASCSISCEGELYFGENVSHVYGYMHHTMDNTTVSKDAIGYLISAVVDGKLVQLRPGQLYTSPGLKTKTAIFPSLSICPEYPLYNATGFASMYSVCVKQI